VTCLKGNRKIIGLNSKEKKQHKAPHKNTTTKKKKPKKKKNHQKKTTPPPKTKKQHTPNRVSAVVEEGGFPHKEDTTKMERRDGKASPLRKKTE